VVVGQLLTGLIPDMFLGIEVRTSRREENQVKMGVSGPELLNLFGGVPGSTVQQE